MRILAAMLWCVCSVHCQRRQQQEEPPQQLVQEKVGQVMLN
jgi:hypothetical protein